MLHCASAHLQRGMWAVSALSPGWHHFQVAEATGERRVEVGAVETGGDDDSSSAHQREKITSSLPQQTLSLWIDFFSHLNQGNSPP